MGTKKPLGVKLKSLKKLLKKSFVQMNNANKDKRDIIWYDASMDGDQPSGYKNVDPDEFPTGQYVLRRTGQPITALFSTPNITGGASICHHPADIIETINKFGFTRVHASDNYDEDDEMVVSKFIYEAASEDGKAFVLLTMGGMPNDPDPKKNKKMQKNKIRTLLAGAGDLSLYEEVKRFLISRFHKVKYKSNNVNLVIASSNGYDTQEFDLPQQKIDIGLNYGKDFIPVHKKIIESLNKPNSKGLVLLHGDPGTGKTHYLKYIASKVKDKKVLFIPPYLADFITSPEMTPFLIENANSILFIEDAERVITDRSENGSTGVSNILNITDGILSDILKIQIVATFNMDKKKIDPALLRKGRLIAEHKFGPLSIDDSNRLLKHLEFDHTTTKEMTLTEIYNLKDQHYMSEESIAPRRIGFGIR